MSLGSQILIFDAVGSQIQQNISLVVSLQFSVCSNKAIVPADLYVLLSTAKNLPEYNIRTNGQRS